MFTTPRIVGFAAILFILSLTAAAIYRAGGDGVRNAIERQDNVAASRAEKGAFDYDACRDAGRVWDFRAGKCGRVSTDSRD